VSNPEDLPPAAEEAVYEAANLIVGVLEHMIEQLPEGIEPKAARERRVDYLQAWPELREWQVAHITLQILKEEADRL